MEYSEPQKKRTLLVVEDDPSFRLMLRFMLKRLGIDVIYADSAEEALKLVEECSEISGMLLDVSLGGGISGLDLGKLIKTKQRFKNTPMIAMTAYPSDRIGDYQGDGFTGYLQKPYSLDQLDYLLDTQVIHPEALD